MFVVESAGMTDVGRKRKNNEDALFIDDKQNLYVVADGMGGHRAGEVASMIVIDTIREFMQRPVDADAAEDLPLPDDTLSAEANRLVASIQMANLEVHETARSKEVFNGMGSTVSAIMFSDEAMIAANVGDSPIYLIHNGKIERLSVPHNVITEQAAIDPDAAQKIGKAFGHMLTRAMGLTETVQADVSEIPVFRGDKIVISSDGLSDKVSPEEILEVMSGSSVQEACRTLVQMANDRGGDDNVTVITLHVNAVSHSDSGLAGWMVRIFSPLKKLFS
ncbi:MAG: protein phosphatase 2C domain-containing protein [Pseudomonadota bacterium]